MRIHAIPTKRHDQALVRHLAMDEVRAILDAPNLTTRLGIRDRAMLHLCFACGLRVSELVELPLANISLHRTPSIRVYGKGRKERVLPLWKATTIDLRVFILIQNAVAVTNKKHEQEISRVVFSSEFTDYTWTANNALVNKRVFFDIENMTNSVQEQ